MNVRFRYKLVFEGEYEVDPAAYYTNDPNEIAEWERRWATEGASDFIEQNELDPVEVIVIPI